MATSENICGLKREDFMTTVQGKQTDLYVLRNSNGAEIAVTNFGGAIAAIMVPDKDGNMANVIQGHDNINDDINTTEPFLSTLIGRFGNRIKEGKFILNGKEYNVALNDGPNHLHGGPTGYHARVWDALQMNDSTLVLNYVSSYGETSSSSSILLQQTRRLSSTSHITHSSLSAVLLSQHLQSRIGILSLTLTSISLSMLSASQQVRFLR